VYIKAVDNRNKVMIVVDHICQFHFFLDKHANKVEFVKPKIAINFPVKETQSFN